MDTIQEKKVYDPEKPWDYFDLSPHAYRKLQAAFTAAFREMCPDYEVTPELFANLPHHRENEFRFFVAGKRSVKIWEAQKLSIITSGSFTDMELARAPRFHQSFKNGTREMERLSKRHKDKPFFLFALTASAKNGATLSPTELRELTEQLFSKPKEQAQETAPVVKPRYHGFTCPNCGSHMFGTHTHYAQMGDKYPPGTRIGTCNEHCHSGNGCSFQWNRDDPVAENACMYQQTHEEYMAEFDRVVGDATIVKESAG